MVDTANKVLYLILVVLLIIIGGALFFMKSKVDDLKAELKECAYSNLQMRESIKLQNEVVEALRANGDIKDEVAQAVLPIEESEIDATDCKTEINSIESMLRKF